MVKGNRPVPIERTVQAAELREWDRGYWQRSRECPLFLATRTLFVNVADPPIVKEANFEEAFGRVPGLENPPTVAVNELEIFLRPYGVSLPTRRSLFASAP
jgi:hypothetical protein